jgi:hypothetical protein
VSKSKKVGDTEDDNEIFYAFGLQKTGLTIAQPPPKENTETFHEYLNTSHMGVATQSQARPCWYRLPPHEHNNNRNNNAETGSPLPWSTTVGVPRPFGIIFGTNCAIQGTLGCHRYVISPLSEI